MNQVSIFLIWYEPDVRILLRFVCQREGFQSYEFDAFDTAYTALATHHPQIAIVQRTLRHPDDGLDFCQRVRHDAAFSHLPVIVGFADIGRGGHQAVYQAGANGYFGRVFNIEGILHEIRALLADPSLTGLVDQ